MGILPMRNLRESRPGRPCHFPEDISNTFPNSKWTGACQMDLESLKYAKTHEWVAVDGNIATIGITDFAVD